MAHWSHISPTIISGKVVAVGRRLECRKSDHRPATKQFAKIDQKVVKIGPRLCEGFGMLKR